MKETKDERQREKRESAQFAKNLADITKAEQDALDEIISVNGWLQDARVWGVEHVQPKIKRRYPGAFGKKITARLQTQLKNKDNLNTDAEQVNGDDA